MGEHFKRRAHHRPATEIGEGIGGIVEQFSAETSHRAGPGQHRPLEFIRAVEHRYPSCSEPAGTGFAGGTHRRARRRWQHKRAVSRSVAHAPLIGVVAMTATPTPTPPAPTNPPTRPTTGPPLTA